MDPVPEEHSITDPLIEDEIPETMTPVKIHTDPKRSNTLHID